MRFALIQTIGSSGHCESAKLYELLESIKMEQTMYLIANSFVGIVALFHIYFLVLEMFLWDKPQGRKIFGLTPEFAAASKSLAANQGLYNGFLAAGLIWGLVAGASGTAVKIFFLACVIIAGIYGSVSVSRKIFFVQALPAIIALVLVMVFKFEENIIMPFTQPKIRFVNPPTMHTPRGYSHLAEIQSGGYCP